jgi:anti-sigma factor RsiW
MSCDRTQKTQRLLDGELHGVTAEEAERHMESCPECQALAADIAHVSDALHVGTRYRASPALRARLASALKLEDRRRVPRGFWLGAASGGGAMALAAALFLIAVLPPSAATLASSVADAHGRALTGGTTIAVVSTDHHTVKPWLAEHVAISPPVTDFAGQGFALAGGRADEVAGATAAVTVYRYGKHEIDLFAWPDRGATLPGAGMVRGFRVAFWKSGDLDFAAVSDIDAAAFAKFTGLARAQGE